MWESIIAKLKAIEDNLLRREKYVDKFDAMSLASVVISSDNFDSALTFIPTVKLAGLSKLVNDILLVLHEAYVDQQGALIVVKIDIDKCRDFADRGTSERHEDETKLGKETSPRSSHAIEVGAPSHEEHTFPADKQSLSKTSRKRNLSETWAMHRRFRLLKLEVHSNLTAILDAKLVAYEVITSSLDMYLKYIVKTAYENGVLDPLRRAKHLVQPLLTNLLAHKFLDTSETNINLSEVRKLWAKAYFHDDVALAERNLNLNLIEANRSSNRGMTKFKMGIGLTLLLWSFSECFNNEQIGNEIWRDPTFAIFMCVGDLLLLLWMWGLSMRVWHKAGIDFVQLLGLQQTEIERNKRPEAMVYSSATDLSIIFLVIFICFNKAVRGVLNIHGSRAFAHIIPVLMIIFFFYRAINPISSKSKWIKMLRDVLLAPLYPIGFRDGYIGDLLTSLVRVLIPLCFSFAYLIMSAYAWLSNNIQDASSTSDLWWQNSMFYRSCLVPFITLFPLWIRFMQCLRRSVETGERFPHMANACKYASAIGVISYATFRPHLREDFMWIIFFICATIFQFIWDLTMDWGMLLRNTANGASESSFLGISLRKNRLLGSSWLYVSVIFANFFLRFAWALTLLPDDRLEGSRTVYTIVLSHLTPLVAALEVIRRMVWGFFRLEYEQLETLGSPEFSSELFLETSHKSFEKMHINSSTDSFDGIIDMKSRFHDIYDGHTGDNFTSEWILSAPFFATISEHILRIGILGITSNVHMKARFVESFFFTFCLSCVVLSAAAPHFVNF